MSELREDTATVEVSAATVEEATRDAIERLAAPSDEVVVEVLARGGASPIPGEHLSTGQARVRATRVDPRTARALALLRRLLDEMEIAATVSVRRGTAAAGADAPLILQVSGDDLGLLIGWRGETLRALQTTLNLMVDDGQARPEGRPVIVDVERYRARREDQVRDLARRLAERVKASGERYTLDPMPSYERRAIHLALEDDSGVRTESSGAEPARRVVIHPTGPARGGLESRLGRGRGHW